MKQVQDALADIGIPVQAGIWRTDAASQSPPDQYVVYSSTTTEYYHMDDCPMLYKTYVYLNLWSVGDPTDMARTIRSKMYAAGFSMVEETDKGYNQPAYDTNPPLFTVGWTWALIEEATPSNGSGDNGL